MNTSGSVKMLVIAATAAVSLGAVAVPKTFVASVPTAVATIEAVGTIKTVNERRENTTLAFVRPFSPDLHACTAHIGGKFNGLPTPIRSPDCAFRADL